MAQQEGLASDALPSEVTAVLRPLETLGRSRSTSTKRVGAKAATLGRLSREGILVPRGWVLDSKVFKRLVDDELPRGHDVASLIKIAGTRSGIDRAARARERILKSVLPDEIGEPLRVLWDHVAPIAPWGLGVRSSATCEDEADASLAGLATTILGARGLEEIFDAVRQVWASLYLPRTLDYLARQRIGAAAMPVLLQVMVQADAAGVMFTGPPPGLDGPDWRPGERLVSSALGLGALVVEGSSATDQLRLDVRGDVVEHVVAEKRTAQRIGERGLETVTIDGDAACEAALQPADIAELARLATRVEELFASSDKHDGRPLDIEFAVGREGGVRRVFLLQARPVTGGAMPEGGDAETVWSRANVGEALPGAATPLTWSIARSFSDVGFRDAFAALGCRVPKGVVLVSNVYGRFYLNLTAFMRVAAQVPGLSPRTLLSASGGADDATMELLAKQSEDVSKRRFLLRAPLIVPRLLASQANLEREVAAFEERTERRYRSLLELDLSMLPDDGVTTTMASARRLLEETGSLMLRCASASLAAHVALSTAVARLSTKPSARGDDTDQLSKGEVERVVQSLASGIPDLDSVSPGVALLDVAAVAAKDEPARAVLASGRAHKLADVPPGPTRQALEDFVQRFGDRAVREAELATPRWSEDPSTLFAMLTAAVRAPSTETSDVLARARAASDRELALLEQQLSAPLLALVRALVGRAQRLTRLRERMRTWVTRALGMIRYVALDVDRRLRHVDPQLEAGSVFFCTYEELMAALGSGRPDIGHIVRLRRAEFLRDSARPDPPASFVGRPPAVVLPPINSAETNARGASPGVRRWKGLAASGGLVEGRARVIRPGGVAGFDTIEPGEILVARTTDVAISPLFLLVAGVVTELGGPLSHAAIVAREYGVPAVVSVSGITLAIRTGDHLRVDGDRGIVERIDEEAPSEGGTPTWSSADLQGQPAERVRGRRGDSWP